MDYIQHIRSMVGQEKIIMVVAGSIVFENENPNKKEYRRFKIRMIKQNNDVGMLEEVLRRRFNNPWPLPDLILVDGGKFQVNAANKVIEEFGLKIPVVGIAKGKKGEKISLSVVCRLQLTGRL